jgi:predicted metal-binding protein
MIQDELIKSALQMGADHAVLFSIEDIEFDSRTILKCMFGCTDWGKGHTCPSRPGALSVFDYQKVLKEYSWGIIVHSTNKSISQDVSFALEREAFLKGYYMAFSMSDCAICADCRGRSGRECANPKKARPAFHSVGIDVYKTARKFGLPIETLKDESQEQNWYSAVFVE